MVWKNYYQMLVIVPTFVHTIDEVILTKRFRILPETTPKGDIVSQALYL